MHPDRELAGRHEDGVAAAYRRARRLLLTVLAVYAALLATHRGEFWPASIYPMFSQAGRPWTRAVVRAVPPDHAMRWAAVTQAELPGQAFALTPRGIGNNDVANFVAKTRRWDGPRVAGLRKLFAPHLQDRALVFYAARGQLEGDTGLRVWFEPVVILRPQGQALRPDLAQGGPTP